MLTALNMPSGRQLINTAPLVKHPGDAADVLISHNDRAAAGVQHRGCFNRLIYLQLYCVYTMSMYISHFYREIAITATTPSNNCDTSDDYYI